MVESTHKLVSNSYAAPFEKDFKIDASGTRAFVGHFLWCRNSKAFCERPFALQWQQPEKDQQHVCVAPPGKMSATPVATFILSTSFHVWASQVKLTRYEIETKQNILWRRNRSWIIYFLRHNCLDGTNLRILLITN